MKKPRRPSIFGQRPSISVALTQLAAMGLLDGPSVLPVKCDACDGEGWIGPPDVHRDGSISFGRECRKCSATGYVKPQT
jgi:hypothetical protein